MHNRRRFFIRLLLALLGIAALALAVVFGDWRALVFASVACALLTWWFIRHWAVAFPQRTPFLLRPVGRVPARLSDAQRTVAGLVASLIALSLLVVAYGLLDVVALAVAVAFLALLVVHLVKVVRREGWSGSRQ